MPFTLAIDAGHGGDDAGACYHGLRESDWALEWAYELWEFIEQLDPSVHVILTRATDERVSLRKRAKRAAGADLVWSIHVNAMVAPPAGDRAAYDSDAAYNKAVRAAGRPMKRVDGAMAFARANDIDAGVAAKAWASTLPQTLRRTMDKSVFTTAPDDWTQRAHNVLANYDCPAILFECGFATSPRDADYLRSHYGRIGLLCAFGSSLAAYREQTGICV